MNNNKRTIIVGISLSIILILILVYIINTYKNTNTNTNSSDSSSSSSSDIQSSELSETSLSTNYDETDLDETYSNITATITLEDNNTQVNGTGATVNNNIITITAGGTYYVTGTLTDGNIVISATKNDNVKIVLAGVNITSSNTSAIYCEKAKKLVITLKDGTTNYIEDGETYNIAADTDEPDGAIFSKSDLTINGSGNLEVKANYKDGIVSKDGLKIINSTIKITSADDGIRGKDYTEINKATITINAQGDGIKSTNDQDTTLGYIIIEDSNITIDAQSDGIQAKTIVDIKSGIINIKTAGGSTNSKKTTSTNGFYNNSTQTNTDDSSSAKGIKGTGEIIIEGGTIVVNSSDDAIHSNGNILISNGTMNLQTGDDGIHADSNITISGGTINISKSYEGIEGMYIEINGGTIEVISSDDGINVAGGTDSSSVNGRTGQNSFNTSNSNEKLVINGGTIMVNATGDGLDSNGSMYINGGTITVYGPTANDNGALDYNGECIVTGGTLIAVGSSGMMQAPSTTSTQCSLTTTISGSAGDKIEIKTSNGEEIVSFTSEKTYQMLTFSSSKLQTGETYSIYVNGTLKTTVTQSTTTTQNGTSTMSGRTRRI